MALRPLSEPWPLVLSSSIQSHVSPLRADLCYWAISHPSALCLSIYSSAFRWAFFLWDFLPEFVSGFCCSRCSKTPLIRTLVIRIAKYPAWLDPSGKFFENSTKLTYLEITSCRIKYRTVLWLVELQIRQGRKVRTQVHTVNSNSRTSNCQCSLFSKKNPIIRIFCIFGWLAVPINSDMWSSTALTTCPAHCNPLIWVYVTRAMSLYNPCCSSRYHLPRYLVLVLVQVFWERLYCQRNR